MLGLGFGLAIGLGFGLASGSCSGSGSGSRLGIGLTGLAFGLAAGLMVALTGPETWSASLTFAQLAARWHTPIRLMRFLEDARDRNVLRTIGPVYQFRHARLQDRLAEQATATKQKVSKPASLAESQPPQ